MTYDQLIAHYGTPAAAASAINADRQRVHGWKTRNSIPLEAQIEIEIATGGALRADVPDAIRSAGEAA